jgi:hypothetical protein
LTALTQFYVYSSPRAQSSEKIKKAAALLTQERNTKPASNAILLQRRLVVKEVFVMDEGLLLTTAKRIY